MHADAAAVASSSIPVQQPEFALGDTEMLLTDQGRSVYQWEGERDLV